MTMQPMTHERIRRERIVDRYLTSRLGTGDADAFEEHLFACSACLAEVEAGEQLRRGLQAVAADQATRAQGLAAFALFARLRRHPARIAGFVLVALLPLLALWQQVQLQQLRQRLDAPTGAVQLVSLGVVRDTEATEVVVDPTRTLVLLSLELPLDDAPSDTATSDTATSDTATAYTVTLDDSSGDELWRSEPLEPSLYGSLLVAVPTPFLAPGTYRLVIEPVGRGTGEPAGTVPLRVVRPDAPPE